MQNLDMKKIVLLVLGLFCASAQLGAWNAVGHSAVAQIAEDHIGENTRKALKKYLKGTDIVQISSYPDQYYYEWYRDIGWKCSNPEVLRRKPSEMDALETNWEPWSHSYTVDSLCQVYRHNREGDAYVRNAVMDLDGIIRNLKENLTTMEAEEREKELSLVVHLIGDMHCPMHVLYVPQAPTGGKYSIYIAGKKINIHSFWDSQIWKYLGKGWGYSDFANEADTATQKEIAQIIEGDIFDWASRNAKDAWPAHHLTGASHEERELDSFYPETMRQLAYQQLRNAGYRLAKVLDDIFAEVR